MTIKSAEQIPQCLHGRGVKQLPPTPQTRLHETFMRCFEMQSAKTKPRLHHRLEAFYSLQENFIRSCVTPPRLPRHLRHEERGAKKTKKNKNLSFSPMEHISTWHTRCFKHAETKTLERRMRWNLLSGSLQRRDFHLNSSETVITPRL